MYMQSTAKNGLSLKIANFSKKIKFDIKHLSDLLVIPL